MLSNIIGRPQLVTYMGHYLKSAPYHPLLLIGDEGVGKTYLATLIFKYLNCTEHRSPTCTCQVCVDPKSFESYNLFVLEKTSWGVEEIRVLSDSIQNPSISSNYRVIIFDRAESLTPEGSDVFLKIVEEHTPFNVFVFLTSQPAEVMPALRSRCWSIYLPPVEAYKTCTAQQVKESWGNPAYLDAGVSGDREKALLFVESMFEPNVLSNLLRFKDQDIPALLQSSIYNFAAYTQGSEYAKARWSALEAKVGRVVLYNVYIHLRDLYSKLNQYPSLRDWNQFFQTCVEIQFSRNRSCPTGV
jgi:hypothetical protein